MNSPRKGTAGSPTNAAEFYDYTRRLLLETIQKRDPAKLRRCAIRVDSERFSSLSDSRQDDLLELYAGAMVACGALSP